MKVEHITALTNNSVVRDTTDILPETRLLLADMKVSYTTANVEFPKSKLAPDWKIRITATETEAAFDIMKGDFPCLVNFCCFGKNRDGILEAMDSFLDEFPLFKLMGGAPKIRRPKEKFFLITVPTFPTVLSRTELMTAGEVELYIYNELYIGWKEQQN
jgi:hypothetical protein